MFVLDYKWKLGKFYFLELMFGVVIDIYSLKLDMILQDINVDLLKNYGNLFLIVDSFFVDLAYIIELLDGENVIYIYKVFG